MNLRHLQPFQGWVIIRRGLHLLQKTKTQEIRVNVFPALIESVSCMDGQACCQRTRKYSHSRELLHEESYWEEARISLAASDTPGAECYQSATSLFSPSGHHVVCSLSEHLLLTIHVDSN